MILTEIDHPSHEHKLELECNKKPYKCDGCKERGFGDRYRCEGCNYDLHKDCALARPFRNHPFYRNCLFEFLEQGGGGRVCDACGMDVHGFVYHCYKTGYDMHPCCANLPHVLQGDGVKLVLKKSLSSKCGECGTKGLYGKASGWSYKSAAGKYQFHVSCVKAMLPDDHLDMNSLVCLDGNISNLQLRLQSRESSSQEKSKYWKMVKIVLKLIISAIVGDPTAIISFVFESLVSH